MVQWYIIPTCYAIMQIILIYSYCQIDWIQRSKDMHNIQQRNQYKDENIANDCILVDNASSIRSVATMVHEDDDEKEIVIPNDVHPVETTSLLPT
jgi:hypothetical protein